MQLNSTTDYAIRILLYMDKANRMVSAQEIAEAMSIPRKYINNILLRLKEAEYVKSYRGLHGGYTLTEKSQDITLGDVIQIMEDSLFGRQCTVCETSCRLYDSKDGDCPVRMAYSAVHMAMSETAQSITIRQLSTQFTDRDFKVYYQPIIALKSGKVSSAEALARRIMPGGAVQLPEHFVPVLESTGGITRLDKFVAGEVFELQRRRAEQGLPCVPISINLSQNDFCDPAFMEFLGNTIQDPVLPRGSIHLEMTETTYALQAQHREYIQSFAEHGAQIVLDDFGFGYSTFSRLQQFELHKVKLDKAFMANLCENRHVQVAVESIISMCHKLSIEVVAEGVETAGELELLREMDCDYIQGFYFARPMDAADYADYLRQHLGGAAV